MARLRNPPARGGIPDRVAQVTCDVASVVITLIGDDRAGLVDAVSGAIAQHGGNWDRSHLAELAGKFAGIVLVELPDAQVDGLLASLDAIESQGTLTITAESAGVTGDNGGTHVTLELTGQDHAGIVHEISHVLAHHGVSIDELETAVTPAPQGGNLFIANAVLELPDGLDVAVVAAALEAVTHDLMVDLTEL